MNQSEYAKHRGITKQAVSKLVKNDRILLNPDGSIDVAISDTLLESAPNTVKVKRGGRGRGGHNPTYNTDEESIQRLQEVLDYPGARAKYTKYKAELARLEFEEEDKQLVRVQDVKHEAFECARKVRNKVLSVVDRVSGLVAAEQDEFIVRGILEKELRNALEELSQGKEEGESYGDKKPV